jgi:outer membrane protein
VRSIGYLRSLDPARLRRKPPLLCSFLRPLMLGVPMLAVPIPLFAQATVTGQAQADTSTRVLTLEQAISLATTSDPAYAASAAARGSAKLDRSITRSSMLPSVVYHNQYLYTQPNGLKFLYSEGGAPQPLPIFIANNAIHEYTSQAEVTENLNVAGFIALSRAGKLADKADADLEISRRDLVVRVVSGYFGVIAAMGRLQVVDRSTSEARAFANLTRKLEAGREVAHADVIKSDLGVQQSERELSDVRLAADKAKLDLATLLFPDPRVDYSLADATAPVPILPAQQDVEAAAAKYNPDVRSALEAARAANEDVTAARAAYLPLLSFNYTYGIDAAQFAVNSPEHAHNLGYSAYVNLDIPVWDWFATHDRVKQGELRRQTAETVLTAAQRRLIADLQEFYDEAKVAHDQLVSLMASVQTAQESLRLTKLKYSTGEATALEVVDAQRTLTAAELANVDGMVRYRVALANLQTLTGVL